ncbi:M23 family metallopeptidase [Paenibacillus sp. CF384]|uniref:M23 family metallopeptidase n=1 Tax=Paenibacillus sp. CF384 TaxID=1884382 RepID=UPI000899AC9E|nr:M23 family metallopeptidase [Paenibacillus sp. CF384]SDX27558.1 stage II sporulation protein Q [Paenibacillus sp. CF384]
MSDNKSKFNEEAPKNVVGGTAVKPSAWRKLLAKKWAAPSAFLAAAAIIVTLMWLYGGAGETSNKPASTDVEVSQGTTDGMTADQLPADDEAVNSSESELMKWPVDRSQLDVVAPFYDAKATGEERQAALIQSGNTFVTNMGIDFAKNDTAFDVSAALSGRVIVSEKHPLNGNIVEIKHADGIVTVYHSLSDVQVKVGDEVKQGTVIAKAGRSELEKELGVHMHFEVRKDGKAINPNTFITSDSASATEN